jgi:Dolichyl-phosphate-mannose-protein mannosyltransferase
MPANRAANVLDTLSRAIRLPFNYDATFIVLFLAIRSVLFVKYVSLILFHPSVFCEMIDYAKVGVDLAGGEYFVPVVHGYGIPFTLYYVVGKFISLFDLVEYGAGVFQFIVDCSIVPFTYLLGRIAFNRRTGLLAAFFAAFSPLYMMNAAIILVSSAAFHVPALLFLFLAQRDRHAAYTLLAGFFFGLPDGGGRFAPFLFTAAVLFILFSRRFKNRRREHLFFLGLGFSLTLVHLLAISINHPEFFFSLFLAFTASGFEHVEVSRALYQQVPQKVFEFLVPFFLYNPLCTLQLVAASIYLPIKTLFLKQELNQAERFVWSMIAGLGFLLAFVFTQAEPEIVLGDMVSRPIRYFFVFVPLIELISSYYLAGALANAKSPFRRVMAWPWLRGVAGAVLCLVLVGLPQLPPAVEESKIFAEAEFGPESVLLTNFVPIDTYRHFKRHKFALNYGDYARDRRKRLLPTKITPMEFYSRQFYKGPLNLTYEDRGNEVKIFSWFMNMPAFSFEAIASRGVPTGEEADLYFYFLKKTALWDKQRRYRERLFIDAFNDQEDDWELTKRANPGFDWTDKIIFENDDEVLAHVRFATVAYRSLELCFDRRDALNEGCDFTVPGSFVYLEPIGFGWISGTNLTDPGDWEASRKERELDSCVFVDDWIANEFTVRTVPGRYRVEVEWSSPPAENKGLSTVFPGRMETEQQWRTVFQDDGRRISTTDAKVGDKLRLRFGRKGQVLLHRLRLVPNP